MNRRFLIAVAACVIAATVSTHAHASYKSELKRASATGRLYDLKTGNAKLIMRATLFTDAFRRAFAEKHADVHYMNPMEAAAYRGEQEAAQAGEWLVFISLYTRKAYKKFSLADDTFWKVYLTDANGYEVVPTSIEKLKKTPYWRVMFPYIDQWAQIYMVRFPKAPLSDDVQMTMESVVGQRTITWKVGH